MAFIGNTPTTQAFVPAIDYFSGNGSAVTFTLSRPVGSNAQVQVVVENVPQAPGDAYSISGNSITFTSAPPVGANNIYVYYTSPITQIIAPSQGTVSQLSLGTINFYINPQDITANYTIPAGFNAMTAGPVTVASGVTITVPNTNSWAIV